ncbi:MAG: cell division protein FtsQ/DivIB [Nitrospirota bacterium]
MKRRGRVRRFLGSVVLCAGGVVIAGWTVNAVCWVEGRDGLCGLDAIEQVDVRGTVRLTERQVREWAAVPMGASLWNLDGEQIASRLDGRSWIRAVTVRKRFPHAVVLDVTERVPAAVAVTDRGRVLLDADGLVIGPTAIDRGFPVVRGGAIVRPEGLAAAAHILAGFRVAAVSLAAIESVVIDVSHPEDPIVELPGALRVRFGRDRFAEKWRRVQAIQAASSGPAVPRMVDVRFSDRAVVSEWSGAL